jgi:hypothetical protein
MKRVFIALVVLFVIACRKTPTPVTPKAEEFKGYKVELNAKTLGMIAKLQKKLD